MRSREPAVFDSDLMENPTFCQSPFPHAHQALDTADWIHRRHLSVGQTIRIVTKSFVGHLQASAKVSALTC